MPTSDSPHVLVFLHSFEPGGVERIALRLTAFWQRTGAHVSLFLGRTEGAMGDSFRSRVRFAVAPAARLPIGYVETLWMIVQLARHIRKIGPDMLFAAGNSYAVVAVAMKLLLGRTCPPIVMKVSNDLVRSDMIAPYAGLYRLWLRIQGHTVDRFVAMTDALADQIAQEMRVAPGRIEVISNPSLDDAVPATAATEKEVRSFRSFCAVGRLTRQKNLAMMLRAFARGAGPQDKLTLYGDGPDRARLEVLANRLGIGARVTFAGFVACPSDHLVQHDCLLLSSRFEGLPSVVLEAMEAGLHIVATECCCSMEWLLDQGRLGTLIGPGDEAAMARAISAAPSGQRLPHAADARVDAHRIGRIAPAYLDLFARTAAERAVIHEIPSSELEFAR
jgi:glycosyltransferase involved in cell wall biosynthesis